MRALFWNWRGFGARGCKSKLCEHIISVKIDLICLQKMIKFSISPGELSSIVVPDRFAWRWAPASGHSWGILVWAILDVFDVVAFEHGIFSASLLLHKSLNKLWEIIVVYGPGDHSLSPLFLDELFNKLESGMLVDCRG